MFESQVLLHRVRKLEDELTRVYNTQHELVDIMREIGFLTYSEYAHPKKHVIYRSHMAVNKDTELRKFLNIEEKNDPPRKYLVKVKKQKGK